MTGNHLPVAIQNFIQVTNHGDSDAFVAAFTEDAYLNDWGREFHGHELRAARRADREPADQLTAVRILRS